MKILKFSLFNSILKQQLTLAINTLQHLCLHQSKKNVSTNHLTSPEFLMFRQTTTVVRSPMDKATCSRFKIRKVQPNDDKQLWFCIYPFPLMSQVTTSFYHLSICLCVCMYVCLSNCLSI